MILFDDDAPHVGIDRTWCDIINLNQHCFILFPDISQIFFVMRKKNSQVSTLHVIHHGCMPMSVWFGVKFTPGKCSFVVRERMELSVARCSHHVVNEFPFIFMRINHRWSQYVLRSLEHIRAHRHVFVLSVLGTGTTIPKIPLVEKVPYCIANGMKVTHTHTPKHFDQQNFEIYSLFISPCELSSHQRFE